MYANKNEAVNMWRGVVRGCHTCWVHTHTCACVGVCLPRTTSPPNEGLGCGVSFRGFAASGGCVVKGVYVFVWRLSYILD